MGRIIYGSEVSAVIKEEIKEEIAGYRAEGKRSPHLEVILAGNNPASLSYIKGKKKAAEEVGIELNVVHLAEDVSQEELNAVVRKASADEAVDGILVQLPLPAGLDDDEVLSYVDPQKDVDGLHLLNVGKLFSNKEGMVPCTPLGIMELLDRAGVEIAGKRAVVIGRSRLVGTPVARLLQNRNATVTICHSRTENLKEICREADILIAAIGKAHFITEEYVKEGAAVIDVGVNRLESGKLAGDVDFARVQPLAGVITPVPKGVGPMTIACLLQNTLKAYRRRV